jgi:glycosyltransferase involved in cell wall biosynthesis
LEEVKPDKYSQEERESIRKDFGIPVGNKVIAFIARLHPQKRPMDFVELARRYQRNASFTFLMVGDGPQSEQVVQTIEKLSLNNFIRSSFYSPIADVYAITDVLVILSEYEATPLVLLESQAMGVSVVSTDVGNIRDVLRYSGGGIVVKSIGNIEEVMNAIPRALALDLNPAEMWKKIYDRYSVPIISRKFKSVFLGEFDE